MIILRTIGVGSLGAGVGFFLGRTMRRHVEPLSLASGRRPGYPVLEGLVALLFAAASLRVRDLWVSLVLGGFLAVLATAALIDARHRIIPNRLVLPSLALFGGAIAALSFLRDDVALVRGVLGLLAFGGCLLLIAILSPRGMGMGDVKLGGLIGLVLGALGWSYVGVAAFMGVGAGGLAGVALLLAGRGRKATMPFGPSLAAGAAAAALFAPEIARWYTGLVR